MARHRQPPCRRPHRRRPAAGVVRRKKRPSDKTLAMTAPACLGAPSRPSEAPIPTTTTDSTALPRVRNAGNRPAENQIAAVMSMLLPAGQANQDDLACARHQSRSQKHQDVPPRRRLGGRIQQGRAGTRPHEMLHGLQDQRQRRGAGAGAKTGQHDRQPKARAGVRPKPRYCRAGRIIAHLVQSLSSIQNA
jgi:hypothetical protein